MSIDHEGDLYVIDSVNYRIQQLIPISNSKAHTATQHHISVNNNQTLLEIESSSAIDNFTLDPQSKRAPFDVNGNGSSSNNFVIIPIGKILVGPYTIFVDGSDYKKFVIFNNGTLEDTLMTISFDDDRHHSVNITSANVAP
jgi:hypothetical protein